jgi:predicted NAD-dependent protein-ADP-ribosyltransferase YbiA (DUF1768 family)
MPQWNRTYRVLDDGERIEGTWRPIFIKNGPTYFLADLKIYADGLIDCWGLVDIDEFREKVRQGWVATTLARNGEASAHHLARWRFKDPQCIAADQLIAEVQDTIAELQGIPTTPQRFDALLEAFVADPSEANRSALREGYHAVPEHMRMYVLHDQDMADWPVKVSIGELGELVMPRTPPFEERPITAEDRQRALDYFAARKARAAKWRDETHAGDPDGPAPADIPPSIGEGGTAFAKGGGWVDMSGDGYLSNDVPTPIVVDGIEYPSVTHAYWSLSTDDSTAADAIRLAPRASEAFHLGEEAARRPGWSDVRLAVMTNLVRAKFDQHPDLAARLMATGDARISGAFSLSGRYWQGGAHGRNWLGRILELVRSELRLRQAESASST